MPGNSRKRRRTQPTPAEPERPKKTGFLPSLVGKVSAFVATLGLLGGLLSPFWPPSVTADDYPESPLSIIFSVTNQYVLPIEWIEYHCGFADVNWEGTRVNGINFGEFRVPWLAPHATMAGRCDQVIKGRPEGLGPSKYDLVISYYILPFPWRQNHVVSFEAVMDPITGRFRTWAERSNGSSGP